MTCIVWQALVIGAVAVAVGVPLGLVAGRGAWWAVADPTGVKADALRPWQSVLVVGAGALVAAVLLATVLGRVLGQRASAEALRAE